MQVFLEAIKFNHDPTSETTGAFNLRRNETEVVNIPEWQRGASFRPEDSPAAYSPETLVGTPAIRARFQFLDVGADIKKIRIRALDGQLHPKGKMNPRRLLFKPIRFLFRAELPSNILGAVAERDIDVRGGEEFELFSLDSAKVVSAGVTASDIIWRWQFRTDSTDWEDFEITSHRIYTVLARPKHPWQPESSDSSNTQQPWTEVLDYACRWANSATNVNDAATLITQRVNSLGPTLVHYDNPNSGSSGFTLESPPTFDCTEFLTLLRTQTSRQGARVNCDDCATFVASFANILGCDLNEGRMGTDFKLNPHLRIGAAGLEDGRFTHHTVAWTGDSGEDDELFDACVQLRSDKNPAESHSLFLPTNIRFGHVNERMYRFRLAVNEKSCRPLRADICRRIGVIGLNGDGPSHSSREAAKLFVSKFFSSENEFLSWKLGDYRLIHDTDSLFSIQSFWGSVTDVETALRVDIYECLEDPESKLKKIVSSFQLPNIVKLENPSFGDESYAAPTNFAIVFRRGKFVVRLRNVGEQVSSSAALARTIDSFLLSNQET